MPITVRIENAQRCPLCREQVAPAHARRLIACSACETVYHRSCFGEMGGCAVLGCQRSSDPERSTLRTAGERGAKPLATKDPAKQARPKQARETDKPGPPAPLRVQRITLLAWMLLLWLFGIAETWASLVPTLVSVAYLAWRPLHVRRIALVVPAVLILLLLGLLALPMGPPSLFSFWPAWLTLASVVYAAWRRSGTALVVFGLAPAVVIFGLNFSWGVVDYAQGTAVYHSFGYSSRESGNLLPELRCYSKSKGCIRNSRTLFTHEAYNIAVTQMIGLFGPMAGSYIGPYPTRATAYRALSEATFVISGDEVDALWRREFLIDGATVLPEQLANLELWSGSLVPVRLRVVEGQCLLIGDPDSEIWLIDLESGKRFARYCDLGE
jgi:hypothetical protein